ncbi:MAG: hypothetical protein R3B09_12190 [Nannocystaceae bacterium]
MGLAALGVACAGDEGRESESGPSTSNALTTTSTSTTDDATTDGTTTTTTTSSAASTEASTTEDTSGTTTQGASDTATSMESESDTSSSGTTDPSTTSVSSTTDEGTTGVMEGCGDGILQDGEACDDGNLVDGDGCNSDCTPSGALLWSDSQGGGLGQSDEAWGCDVDMDGALYVAGMISIAPSSTDLWYRKYDADQQVAWTLTYNGVANGKDQGRAIKVEPSQNFYVAGYEAVTSQSNNAWIRRLSGDQTPLWTKTYNGVANGSDLLLDVALDTAGGVVAVGYQTVTDQGQDVWMRRYNDAGVATWTRTYAGVGAGNDQAMRVAVGGDGSIFVAGIETVTGEGINMWLAKLDPDGNILWTRVRNGPANKADYLTGVAVDPSGDAIVCGYEGLVTFPWQVWVRRYTGDGMIVWTDTYAGASNEGAYCNDIERDLDGNYVITGAEIVDAVRRVMVRKYDPDGGALWTTTVEPLAAGPDYGRNLAIGPDNSIFVVGAADLGMDGRDMWMGRFSE